MKYFLTFFILILPILSGAQVSHAEDYVPGDQLHYQVCTMPASPGNAGFSILWDFSTLEDSIGGQRTTWILEDTTTWAIDDIIQSATPVLGNGSRVVKSGTESLLMLSRAAPFTYTYDAGLLLIRRSLSYGLQDSNSSTGSLVIPTDTLTGGATAKITVDGSGTIKTPAGTFNDALRVKRVVDNIDSIPGSSLRNLQVSYIWYDSLHTAPLFRIDSLYRKGTGTLQNATVTTATTQYLQMIFPAGIEKTTSRNTNAKAYLDDNNLMLNATLDKGKQYTLDLFNLSGQKLYSSTFVAENEVQRFVTRAYFPAGNYIVVVQRRDSMDTPLTIKLVKE